MDEPTHGSSFLEDQFWSVRTVGQYLGGKGSRPLSRSAIARLVANGVLPAPVMIGGSRRWRRSAVVAAIARLEAAAQKTEKRRVKVAV
jgi:predicted DNA-binding transcriptional regulator AlpA